MNVFERLQEQAELAEERWKEIIEIRDELDSKLNYSVTGEVPPSLDEMIRLNTRLLLLLVEQFKPMGELESLDPGKLMGEMISSAMGGKNG